MPDYTPPSGGSGSGISEAEAITAVQGEATLDLTGDVTVAAGKDFTVDTDTLHVDSSNDRVGIGTTSPTEMLHLSDAGATEPSILIENTGTSASEPEIVFLRSSTGSDSQDIGHIKFKAKDTGGTYHTFASMYADSQDADAGTEDGRIIFLTTSGGSDNQEQLRIDGIDGVSVNSGTKFRATRLRTVPLSSDTDLSETGHAGRYIFVTGSSRTITLPATHAAGVHFTLLSNDANGFTLRTGTGSSDGDNMNGAQTNITVSGRDGVTCISDGTDWVVLGV